MALDDTEGSAGSHSQSIFLRKTGPLANWIWMAILLLAALVFSLWRKNKSAAAAPADATVDDTLPNQSPPPVFILPQNPQPTVPVNVTVNNPSTPPSAPPVATPLPSVNPAPTPGPPAKPTTGQYVPVTVAKYTSSNAPWNSTLWGIAKHYGYGGSGSNYVKILNDPKNAALKKKIGGNPRNLPIGATVYVRLP